MLPPFRQSALGRYTVQFDLASAAILAAVIVGLVSIANSVVFGTAKERIVAIVVLVVSVGAVLLVAASDFGHTQVVLDRPLDSLNFGSQIVVGILAASVGSAAWEALRAVKNIGTPIPPTVIAADEHSKLTTLGAKGGTTTVTGNLVAK